MTNLTRSIIATVFTLLCAIGVSTTFAQQIGSPQDQWARLVAAGEVQPLSGTQTVGNTTLTLLGGYADERIMMINYRVSGELPPLPGTEITLVADSGTTLTPFGAFGVSEGSVAVFRSPSSTTGTLRAYVKSGNFGYDSQTGEYLQGDGTVIGPFNLSVAISRNTSSTGSGSGTQTAEGVTMSLQDFFVTPSGATGVICHNRANHAVEQVVLSDGTNTLTLSNASVPSTNGSGQTCQTLGFPDVTSLGSSASLRVDTLKDVSGYGQATPETGRAIVAELHARGYNAELEVFPDGNGFMIKGSDAPSDVYNQVEAQVNGGGFIEGNWTFDVRLD